MFGGRYMKENIPVLLLKKLTILPSQEVRIELNNELSKKVIDLSTIEFSNKILIVLPSNTLEESPTITDLPKSGVLTLINSKIVLPNNNYRVVLKGLNRVKINNYQSYPNDKSILIGNAKMLYIDKGETLEETALRKRLVSLVNTYIKINPEIDNSIITKINNSASLGDITDIVVKELEAAPKQDYKKGRPARHIFHLLDNADKADLIAQNSLYGRVICRCETITEGEIVDAIRRPCGATTVDGVKRRTRAGMGRCQGGFCGPKVIGILARELGVPVSSIRKDRLDGVMYYDKDWKNNDGGRA